MKFEFNSEKEENDFLDTLFDFLSFSGNSEKAVNYIGQANAAMLCVFITSFAERYEKEIIAFAKEFFKE